MKKIFLVLFVVLPIFNFSQNTLPQKSDGWWDQGVPVMPDDPYIMSLINELGDSLREWDYVKTGSKAKICREIGLAFYDRGLYDAADFYLTRSKNFRQEAKVEKVELSESDLVAVEQDKKVLDKLPENYENISRVDLKKMVQQIENQMKRLVKERDSLINVNAPKALIDSKNSTIKTLEKERNFLGLNIEKLDLEDENARFRRYLFWLVLSLVVLILAIVALLQRKTIKKQDKEIEKQLDELQKKNTYLEHAAKLIRHDMHSGINTYIPRGISTLEKRLTTEDIQRLKIESPLKMIKEGLNHTQKVYKGVDAFTNLVKLNAVLERNEIDTQKLLTGYFSSTSYFNQIEIDDALPYLSVNEPLFCTAIDNLVKNGLKYNDSEIKKVKIYFYKNCIIVEDNGRGMSQKDFENYTKLNKKEKNVEAGIGLNICKAILEEHGFTISSEKLAVGGTKIKIKI